MNVIRRKQREIREREERILEVASQMLGEAGYLGVTMDRIAEAIEYSKGTVYQHFRNKEEMLLALVKRRKQALVEMFQRAAAFPGSTRDRMTAIGEAYVLFTRLYPVEFANLPTLFSPSICDKASPETRQEMLAQDQQCIGTVARVVEEAVARGELDLLETLSPVELVFGLWSMMYGSLTLIQTAIPFSEIGIPDPHRSLARNLQAYLDGVGWRPLCSEFDCDQIRERVRREIFSAELERLQHKE
ncbi:MAG: TetR/AcrR family transcriptional regulator [Gammaproteobacteria bacterium]